MPNLERGFIPLIKVEQGNPADIYVDLNLPQFVDKDRIGVNVERIVRLKHLAGIATILMTGITDDVTSHVVPNIAGVIQTEARLQPNLLPKQQCLLLKVQAMKQGRLTQSHEE